MHTEAPTRQIRVVHILGGRERGGIATHLVSLARHMAEDRFTLSAVLLGHSPLEQMLAGAGFAVQVMPKRRRGDVTLLARLARALSLLHPDIVHTHSVTSNFYGRAAARLARAPAVVTTVHGFVPDILRRTASVPRPLAGPLALLDAKLSRFSDRMIAVSEALAADLRRRGVRPSRIVTIPNGVEAARFAVAPAVRAATRNALGVSPTEPLIGTVGSLLPLRNHALLLLAARQVLAVAPEAKFLVVGEGREGPGLQAMARDLGVADRIIFAGRREDIPELLSAMDIFAQSCDTEGFGLAVLEAMAAGLPIAATRVGAIPELIVDGESGLLTPQGDAPALAAALLRLLRSADLVRRCGRQARARAEEKYAAERTAARVGDLYLEVLGRSAVPVAGGAAGGRP